MHQARFRSIRRLNPLVLLAVTLATLIAASPHASAQGTMGMLPDPITSGELMQYGERLGLSGEQRRALQAIHDEYLRSFRTLREREIAAFLETTRQMTGVMMIPSRDVIDDLVRQWHNINRQIKRLDEQMLAQMQPILTERQLGKLHRVQLARERVRLSIMVENSPVSGAQIVDLSEIMLRMDLHPVDRERIDPMLDGYERRLTREYRSISEATLNMMLASFEVMSELQGDEGGMMNPQRMQEMMERVQEATAERERKLRQDVVALHNYSARTVRQIAEVLDEHTARILRHRYLGSSYHQTRFALQQAAERRYQAALRVDDLTNDQRERLETALRDARAARERIIDEIVRIDLENMETGSTFAFDQERWQKYNDAIQQQQERIRKLDQEASELVKAILNQDQQEVATEEQGKIEQEYRAEVLGERQPQIVETQQQDQAPAPQQRADQFLPPAISAADLATYARILELDDEQRRLAEDLHELYNEQFAQSIENEIKELTELNQRRWVQPSEENRRPPDAALIDNVYTMRERLFDRINALDDEFFNDIQLALFGREEDQRLVRARRARLRDVYKVHSRNVPIIGGHEEANQDLIEIVRRADMHHVDRQRLAERLDAYEASIVEILRESFSMQLAQQRTMDLWHVEWVRRQQENPDDTIFDWQDYQERTRKHAEPLQELQRRMTALNRRTLNDLRSLISEDAHQTVREAYLRRSYPSIYRDAMSIQSHLDRVMKLPDLSDDQRGQMRELVSMYRPEYARLTDAMVDIQRGSEGMPIGFGPGRDEEQWRDFMDRQQQIERLQFERIELNARAISLLQSILREDQLERIGELPDVQRQRAAF